MDLYDNPTSPYAFKVRAFLYEKQQDFTLHELLDADQHAELRRLNPRGEVPALRDGEVVLYDSAVICDYLEARHPSPPLLPSDPALRARCRLLEMFGDTTLDAGVAVLGLTKLFRPDLQESHPEAVERAAEVLRQHWQRLEAELERTEREGGGEWMLGAFSLADLALAAHVAGGALLGVPPSGARLSAWLERVTKRPSVARASAELAEAYRSWKGDSAAFFSRERIHFRDHRIEWTIRAGLGPWLLGEIEADRAFFSPVA